MPAIGIAGLGSIGQRHARLIREQGAYKVLECDPGVAGTLTFEELLARRPAGVIVASPDACHVHQAVAAIRAGAAVLLEKPVAASSADAEGLWAVRTDRVLVGYVLRHSRWFHLVSGLLNSGIIGVPVSFQAMLGAYDTITHARSRFAHPEPNRLYFDYSHEWDYLARFFGPVAEAIASARKVSTGDLAQEPDIVDAVLRMQNGASGTLHLDYVQSPGRRQFLLVGSGGSLSVDAGSGEISFVATGGSVKRWDASETRDDMYRVQLRHFYEVIEGTAAPIATVSEGIHAVLVAEALIRSVESRTWERVQAFGTSLETTILRSAHRP